MNPKDAPIITATATTTTVTQAAQAASHSLDNAAFYLEQAAQMLANGAPTDCPEVVRWIDFGKRKLWQGAEELTGRTFGYGI